MVFKSDDLSHPRAWLRDVVQFTLGEFTADPLNMQRATTALVVVYQYHERLFYDLTRTGKASSGSVEGFRTELTRGCLSFGVVAQAATTQAGHTLAFTNVVHAGAALDILGAAKVQRSIVVAGSKRQLIPLLEDVIAAYRRILDEHGV